MANVVFDPLKLARSYAQRHYKTDAAIQRVVYLPSSASDREIRLVEVNGSIAEQSPPLEPIDFGVDIGGADGHRLLILDVTPAQWKKIERKKLSLPGGWSLEGAVTIPPRKS